MRLMTKSSLRLAFRHSDFVIVSSFVIRHCYDARRGEHRNTYPPGFADGAGPGGLFCGCAFKSWFRGAPGGGIVPGVGPMAGSPGGRSAGGGADALPLSSARSFNHA